MDAVETWSEWGVEEHFYVFVLIFFNLPQPQTENYQRVIMFKLLDKLSNIFVLFVWCNKAAVLPIPTVFNQINSFLIAGIISAQTFYIPIARERHVSSDNVNKFDTVPLCRAFQRPLESKLDKRGRKSSEGVWKRCHHEGDTNAAYLFDDTRIPTYLDYVSFLLVTFDNFNVKMCWSVKV